jgi:hypothetical protein
MNRLHISIGAIADNRASDAARSSEANSFCTTIQRSDSAKRSSEGKHSQMLIQTTERLTGLASDLRASFYNRQEGFEYLGATVGYISWILRNSRAISP